MDNHPDEQFFRSCYLHWLDKMLLKFFPTCYSGNLSLLDIGCGQGRLTIPLSQKYPNMVCQGIDISDSAISHATEKAIVEGVNNNCKFDTEEALNFLRKQDTKSYDIIFLNEVIIYAKDYLEIISEVNRVLSDQGIAMISFRSKFFNLAHSVNNGWFDKLEILSTKNQYKIFGDDLTFSWHDYNDAEKILVDNSFQIEKAVGIGIFCGLPGDPMAEWCTPSRLSEEEKSHLFQLEIRFAENFRNNGRYILFFVSKR
jgi:ubiquinone/menaquinone biosynthesis C-methylase UbiE